MVFSEERRALSFDTGLEFPLLSEIFVENISFFKKKLNKIIVYKQKKIIVTFFVVSKFFEHSLICFVNMEEFFNLFENSKWYFCFEYFNTAIRELLTDTRTL